MKNKKGFELSLRAVALIVLVLTAISTILFFFFSGFRVSVEGSQNITSGAKEEAVDFDVGEEITGAVSGVCKGTPTHTECGYYYEEGFDAGGEVYYEFRKGGVEPTNLDVPDASVEIPSCSIIGGYPIDSWGSQTVWWSDGDNYQCYRFYFSELGTCMDTNDGIQNWRGPNNGCPEGGTEAESCDCGPIKDPFYYDEPSDECDVSCSDFTDAGKETCKKVDGCRWQSG